MGFPQRNRGCLDFKFISPIKLPLVFLSDSVQVYGLAMEFAITATMANDSYIA
ncbi:unnamed protein product [Acidithrix sp. C25]|nr:unnamed protein product [Acidithrix sp. C25]